MTNWREDLATLIMERLETRAGHVVFSDAAGEWTAERVLAKIAEIRCRLDEFTAPHERIVLAQPNSAAFAAALLAVIAAKRVPVLFDRAPENENWHAVLDGEGGVRRSRASGNFARADLVLHTSGSSGEAKGVRHGQTGLKFTFERMIARFGLGETSSTVVNLPLTHTFAMNTQFFPVFFAGGRCHFVEGGFALAKTYSTILETGADFLSLLGSSLKYFQNERARHALPAAERVTHLQFAGEFVSSTHWRAARALFPRARIQVGYGSTETLRVAMAELEREDFAHGLAGQALPDERVEIRDGEIFVFGPNLMIGYDEEADLPVGQGFATGDLGSLHDGALIVAGRKDRRFKQNGFFVSPALVEGKLAALDAIRRCLCLPLANSAGELEPILFVESELSAAETVQKIENCLGREKLNLKVILNSEWILAGNGKVNAQSMCEHGREILKQEPSFRTGAFVFWDCQSLQKSK